MIFFFYKQLVNFLSIFEQFCHIFYKKCQNKKFFYNFFRKKLGKIENFVIFQNFFWHF